MTCRFRYASARLSRLCCARTDSGALPYEGVTMADLAMIERTLRTFCVPGRVVSIQALFGPRRARSHCTADLVEAARIAWQFEQTSPIGVYFGLNPVQPDFAGTSAFPKN